MIKKIPFELIGILMILIGLLFLIAAYPIGLQTAFQAGPFKTDIPQKSALSLMVGIVIIIMGLIVALGRVGLKLFASEF